MRIILFTGKGGVGKTTLAAATAILSAKRRYKTIVISTDAAHSLSDSFETQLSNNPKKIASNLYGQEINAQEEIEKNWGDIQSYLTEFFTSQGIDSIEADELSVFPGMEELFSLMKIRSLNKSSEFEVIIVDCAPTGDTLRLLSAPEITNWYLKHIFPIQRTAAKAVRPVASIILPFPFPEDRVFEAMKKITSQLAEMKEILSDNKKSSIRLVVNPEKMVIKEAQRAFTFFSFFGYTVDLIIVNRILPPEIKDLYFKSWKTIQENYRKMIEEAFSPIPILSSELFNQEVVGMDLLQQMAQNVYGEEDPTRLFFSHKPITIDKIDGGFELSLSLPFVEKKDLDLHLKGEELLIKVGNFKRNILLPRTLLNYAIKGAKFEGERLRIRFSQ